MNNKQLRTALAWTGVLGIGMTSWISVQCSREADRMDDPKDKFKAYLPAIASGVASAYCVLKGNNLANAEIAAMAAGAAYIAKKNRNMLKPGMQQDKKLQPLVKRPEIVPWEGHSIEWTGKGTMLCLEAYSGRFFYSSKKAVDQAIEKLNERYQNGEDLFLNDYYALLGIEKTGFGAQFAWTDLDEARRGEIVIRTYDDQGKHGESMHVIDIYTYPMEV